MADDEIKTMSIPALLGEAEQTGFITEGSRDACVSEIFRSLERIKHLQNLYTLEIIPRELMEEEIQAEEQKIAIRATAFSIDVEQLKKELEEAEENANQK